MNTKDTQKSPSPSILRPPKLYSNNFKIQRRRLEKQLFSKYYELQYQLEKESVLKKLDSFYQTFAHAAKRRFETGETNYLEKITAQAKQKQLHTLYLQAERDVQKSLLECGNS